jgi:DNA-binding PadR family transcriptional regulator
MKNSSPNLSEKFDNVAAEEAIRLHLIKRILDWILLLELKETPNLNGYELTVKEKKRFGKAISPGTVYCILLRLEQKGYINPKTHDDITVYELTNEGEKMLNAFKVSCLRMIPGLIDMLEIINDSE